MTEAFPQLNGWEETKKTLHAYAQALGVVPHALATKRPHWWHISLKVVEDGLVTDSMALPEGGDFHLKMDMLQHEIQLVTGHGLVEAFSMAEGLSALQMGEALLEAVGRLGLEGDYQREKFDDDLPRPYDKAQAETWFELMKQVDKLFRQRRAQMEGEVSPVQLWPHGFDISFEWYGTRVLRYEEGGEVSEYPAQLNLGFSPGEPSHTAPYFYSNPWPFEAEKLTGTALPHQARWHTGDWEGSLYEYSDLAGDPDGPQKLLDYAAAVYEIARPTLMADES